MTNTPTSSQRKNDLLSLHNRKLKRLEHLDQLERSLLKASALYKVAIKYNDFTGSEKDVINGYLLAIFDVLEDTQDAWRKVKSNLDLHQSCALVFLLTYTPQSLFFHKRLFL